MIPLEVIRELSVIYAAIPAVACKGKCQACCCPVGDLCTQLERDRIERKVGRPLNGPEARSRGEPCNMLDAAGRCTVYSVRPTICRIYGLEPGLDCGNGCAPGGLLPVGRCEGYVNEVQELSRKYTGRLPG